MKQPQIHKKIAAVMAELGPIAKDRKNTQQGYSFRGIDELMNALAPAVTKHGIYPTTSKIEDVSGESVTSKSGGAGWRIVRRYTFRFNAEDGSYVETMADGEAIDYGDKASNKAYSVAYREAMFKMFVIPFANEDIEEVSHELQSNAKPVPPKQVTDKRDALKRRIFELCNDIALAPLLDAKDYIKYVQEVTGYDLLDEKQHPSIIDALEAIKNKNGQ
jgi:hypothetical protein